MIEQIRYAWAAEGLSGRGKFQVTAATPGLMDQYGQLTLLAAKLFNYPRPTADSQHRLAFGWLDAVGRRFAFCRRFLPDDQTGHPGNFAAHVLVGSPSEIPLSSLLASYRTDLWWAGPKTDGFVGELPYATLRVPPQTEPGSEPPPVAADLIAALVSDMPVLETTADEQALIVAVRWVEQHYPFLLNGLNFSTFEEGEQRVWFHICGTATDSHNACAAGVAANTLLTRQLSPARVAGIWRDMRGDAPTRRQAFRKVLESLTAAESGRFTVEDLLPSLNTADGRYEVLMYPAAQRCIGDALAAGNKDVARALRDSDDIGTDMWHGIASAMVTRCRPKPVPETRIALLPNATAVNAVTEEHLSSLRQGAAEPALWSPTILRTAIERSQDEPTLLRQLIAAAARQRRTDWVVAESLPLDVRADLYSELTAVGSPPTLNQVAAARGLITEIAWTHPELLATHLATGEPAERRALSNRCLQELPEMARSPRAPLAANRLVPICLADAQLPPSVEIGYLTSIRGLFRADAPSWADVVDRALDSTARTARSEPLAAYPAELDQFVRSLPDTAKWYPLRTAIEHRMKDTLKAAAGAAPEVIDSTVDVVLTFRERDRTWTPQAAHGLLHAATPGQAGRHATVLLRAAVRAAATGVDVAPATDILLYATFQVLTRDLVEPDRRLLSGSKAHQSSGVGHLVQQTVLTIAARDSAAAQYVLRTVGAAGDPHRHTYRIINSAISPQVESGGVHGLFNGGPFRRNVDRNGTHGTSRR